MLTVNELIKKLEEIRDKNPDVDESFVVISDSDCDYSPINKISTKNVIKDGDDFYDRFVLKGEKLVTVICLSD